MYITIIKMHHHHPMCLILEWPGIMVDAWPGLLRPDIMTWHQNNYQLFSWKLFKLDHWNHLICKFGFLTGYGHGWSLAYAWRLWKIKIKIITNFNGFGLDMRGWFKLFFRQRSYHTDNPRSSYNRKIQSHFKPMLRVSQKKWTFVILTLKKCSLRIFLDTL